MVGNRTADGGSRRHELLEAPTLDIIRGPSRTQSGVLASTPLKRYQERLDDDTAPSAPRDRVARARRRSGLGARRLWGGIDDGFLYHD